MSWYFFMVALDEQTLKKKKQKVADYVQTMALIHHYTVQS